ncbi:hypothetical protein K1W54_03855 [Micromonospora sp. CPCC 205371]|nr:hypothetical protein [Micromonospora sp. CPCC 205371]
MALLAEQWNCALFLDHGGDHWFVNRLPGDQWDWCNAGDLDEHHDFYDASLVIERHMRQTAKIPLNPFEPCRQDAA